MKIAFAPPFVDKDVIEEVSNSLSSGWITSGPKVKGLEEEICKLTGISKSVCVNSWTSGAILVLKWFGIKEGDEVIVPAYTYSATALAVLHCGAMPVMVDITDDLTIDVKSIEEAITAKTKVIMPVDIAGWPCDYDAINALVKKATANESKSNSQQIAEIKKQIARLNAQLKSLGQATVAVHGGTPKRAILDLKGKFTASSYWDGNWKNPRLNSPRGVHNAANQNS